MRDYGEMSQTIMHCIFVGPAGVGKSSLMKRLLRLKLDERRTSTQVLEKSIHVEIIRNVKTTAAQVLGLDWKIIDNPLKEASGLIEQLCKQQEMKDHSKVGQSKQPEHPTTPVLKPILNKPSKNQQDYTRMEQKSDSKLHFSQQQSTSREVFEPTKQTSTTQKEYQTTEVDQVNQQTGQSLKPGLLDSDLSTDQDYRSSQQYTETIDFLRLALETKGISGLQNVNPWTLYLTDSGGQPEFQELLPALAEGPSVFFVVFPLNKDLNSTYVVEYVRPNEQKDMQNYLSSLTLQEDILRSLASIASTTYNNEDGNVVKPRVLLVATFKDQVPHEEDRQRKLQEIQNLVRRTGAFHQDMIVCASESQMVFTVNNVSEDESEKDANQIRNAFRALAEDFKVRTPSPWLIFSILVKHLYKEESVISIQECLKVAKQCGIPNEIEFKAALQFLHKQTGVLYYYNEPSELSQIVIQDPQHLFSRVNQLVEKTFKFEVTHSQHCIERFERGIFNKADYNRLTKDSAHLKLNPSMLLKLLMHLKMVLPLSDRETYFMPCAIAHLCEESTIISETKLPIPPLLITFKTGYCPKGLFGALVACIANQELSNCVLDLDSSQIRRDQICFKVGQYRLLLKITPTYIYIELIPDSADGSLITDFCTFCNSVRQLIEVKIAEACDKLQYSNSANYQLSFVCHCQAGRLHPAQLMPDPVKGRDYFQCSQSNTAVVHQDCHVWLRKVSKHLHAIKLVMVNYNASARL